MYILNLIENSFNDLSLKSKIELFLFPLLILVLIWQLFFNNIDDVSSKSKRNFEIKTPLMADKIIDIVEDVRDFSVKNNIKIDSLKTKEKTIDIKIETNVEKQISFIKYLEEYNSFSAIDYLKQDESFLELKLSFNTLYLKKDLVLENEFKILKDEDRAKKNHFNLKAIVGNTAYLNDKWYEENQNIGENFKLVKVENDYVLISDNYLEFKIRLYKNDF